MTEADTSTMGTMGRDEPTVPVHIHDKGRADVDVTIAPLVDALNRAGIATVASCSGHGQRPGSVALADGRELIVTRNFEEARYLEGFFNGANGEPPRNAPHPTATLGEVSGEEIDWQALDDAFKAHARDNRDRVVAILNYVTPLFRKRYARPLKARELEWEGSRANSPYGKFELDLVGGRWTCITPFDDADLPYYARTPHETKEMAMAEAQRRFEAAVAEDRARVSACLVSDLVEQPVQREEG